MFYTVLLGGGGVGAGDISDEEAKSEVSFNHPSKEGLSEYLLILFVKKLKHRHSTCRTCVKWKEDKIKV